MQKPISKLLCALVVFTVLFISCANTQKAISTIAVHDTESETTSEYLLSQADYLEPPASAMISDYADW